MTRILALSGSLRKNSSNLALLEEARRLAPNGVTLEIHPGLDGLPYFNPDLDRDVPPGPVLHFRAVLASADAVLISTPEYAHGIPGVLKNALDWLVADVDFVGKRIGIFFGSASEGSFAQAALIEVLKTMSAQVVPGAVAVFQGSRVGFDSRKISAVLEALSKSP